MELSLVNNIRYEINIVVIKLEIKQHWRTRLLQLTPVICEKRFVTVLTCPLDVRGMWPSCHGDTNHADRWVPVCRDARWWVELNVWVDVCEPACVKDETYISIKCFVGPSKDVFCHFRWVLSPWCSSVPPSDPPTTVSPVCFICAQRSIYTWETAPLVVFSSCVFSNLVWITAPSVVQANKLQSKVVIRVLRPEGHVVKLQDLDVKHALSIFSELNYLDANF